MPTEVIATPRADQQIAELDRTHARAFGEFLDDLAARGYQALGYRLSGSAPVDHLCVKHLRDSLRVVVAFEGQQRAWILLVGRHDDQDPVLNVYAELYRLRPPYLHRQSGRQGNHSGSCWPGRSVRHHADTLIGRRPNLSK